ncbi:MAG: hypothetical protein CL484_05075 [Acidobacteria bacterium]|nr:hypothetical protein [Acidobacteriota bacterium]
MSRTTNCELSLFFVLIVAIVSMGVPAVEAAQNNDHQPTFTSDIAPILQRSCQDCHRTGSIAPMSLLTYEETRPWARSIREKVTSRAMPPWYIDKNIGVQDFKYDYSLSDEEIATVSSWVNNGAPRGNPADMPPPRQFRDIAEWKIGEPDWVVEIPEPFVVAAEAPNWWGDLYADSGLTEDRWIKAVETKPSLEGFPVVHHAVTSMEDTDSEEGDYNFLNEYALGKNGDIFPDGTGRQIKAGAQIKFNMHYAAIGVETTDRTRVGIQFYPKGVVPERKLISAHVGDDEDLDIPAGESNVRHDGFYRLKENAHITAFQAHLHNLGKRQCLGAILPDNTKQILSCADWDFGWHIVYNYEDHVAPLLPKGTLLHVTSWHDNSEGNRWNDDPTNWAGFGQRSSDEMSFAWVSWYELNDESFEQEVEERQAVDNDN